MNVESVHRDAASVEVVVEVTANIEYPRGNLSILPKEPILVATLYEEHSIGMLGFDGHVLLLHWSISPTTSNTLGRTAAALRGR